MLTRCPHCATAFRVGPEQLKKRQGRVRCGACQAVFNALDALVDGFAEETLANDAQQQSAPPSMTSQPPPAVFAPMEVATAPVHRDPAEPRPSIGLEQSFTVDVPVSSAEEAPLPTESSAKEPPALSAGASDPAHWAAAVRDPPDVEPEPSQPPSIRQRSGRLMLGFICWIGLFGALAQATHLWRVELATLVPATRPLLEAACAQVGCTIGLPSEVDYLAIESSDLNPEPNEPTRLRLLANLRNRAPYAQAWPYLELALTDATDQVLARKVITPNEYLAHVPAARRTEGLPGQGELVLVLPLATRHAGAAGYRLYLFHP